jgi:hypothetical protein
MWNPINIATTARQNPAAAMQLSGPLSQSGLILTQNVMCGDIRLFGMCIANLIVANG